MTRETLDYQDLIKNTNYHKIWMRSLANDISRLVQGIHEINTTNTIFFVPKDEILKDRLCDITYCQIFVAYCLQKLEKHHSHMTVGGNTTNNSFDV